MDEHYEFDAFDAFDILNKALMAFVTRNEQKTVEQIEMEDCAFLWDLGIRADEDLVRPSLKPTEREKFLTRPYSPW